MRTRAMDMADIRLFDSHCHLNMREYAGRVKEVLERASSRGVEGLLVVGFDLPSSREAVRLAESYPQVYASVGVHPHDARLYPDGPGSGIESLCASARVVAVGETGLDYHYDNSPRDVQREVFRAHISLARRRKKPLVVHVREAYPDALSILREERAFDVGGVAHCFSGGREEAFAFLDMGFYVSFAGPITYPKAQVLREVFRALPMDRVLAETDSPYLAPQPVRGRRNEPSNLVHVVEAMARIRGLPFEEMARVLWDNTLRAFGMVV